MLYVGLGDKDKAFVELEKTFNERGFYVLFLRFDPFMDSVARRPAIQGDAEAPESTGMN